MKLSYVKINANNIKHEIKKDYFRYRDIFYKSLIVNLCIYNQFKKNISLNTVLEEANYNQYFQNLLASNLSTKELIKEIKHEKGTNIFLDHSLYIDEFLDIAHSDNHFNLYQLTIDECYNIVITNRRIKNL